jgi:1,4-alpha-glucan branching enzyme
VWCRQTGYPGDPRYRDFYRDIGYDVELEYLKRFLPVPDQRSFTGIKYHAISGASGPKRLYDPAAAQLAVGAHARHFLDARRQQAQRMARLMDRPALVVAPYDAELFGHWWYEGPEFLDRVARGVVFEQTDLQLTTPWEYLATHPLQQVVTPSPSSWGEEGYLKTWLNEANAWIYPHLAVAQERMTELVRRFPRADALGERALRQAGRELLLAQASDWPFILRTGTFAGYARRRVETYLLRFTQLYQQVMHAAVDAAWLSQIEAADNVYPDLDYHYWA